MLIQKAAGDLPHTSRNPQVSEVPASEQTLRDSLAYAIGIIDTLSTPMLVLDSKLRIETAGKAFYQTFNVSPDSAEKSFLYDLENGAWNIPALRIALEEVLPLENSFENFEIVHDFPGLGRRVMLLNGRLLRRPDGRDNLILLGIEDVTGRKKIEEELLRSNEDLQRFAYVAAHDLRTPLGAAMGLTEILSARIRDRLDEKENTFLTVAMESLQNLNTLLSDMLRYSTVSAQPQVHKMISLREPLQIALNNLSATILEAGANINFKDLPPVKADRTQLILLFQNIIANAIKYGRPDVAPEITISAVRGEAEWIISIADNGQGFYPEQAEEIFMPFARLQSEGEGSGIGLTTCKRIIERMKGRIWAMSVKGQGSVFHFTLPL